MLFCKVHVYFFLHHPLVPSNVSPLSTEEATVDAQDEFSVQKETDTEDHTIAEKRIDNEINQKVLSVDGTDSDKGNFLDS